MKSLFCFENRETTTGCKCVIFNGFLYIMKISKAAGQAKKTIDSCRSRLFFPHIFPLIFRNKKARLLLF